MRWWTSMALAALCACGSAPPPAPAEPAPAPEPIDAAPPPPDAPPPIDEAHARWLLSRRFRDAGYRILEDVEVDGLTVDGYDPERKVGYEYVAPGEPAPEIAPPGVLIIPATDAAGIEAAAAAVLD